MQEQSFTAVVYCAAHMLCRRALLKRRSQALILLAAKPKNKQKKYHAPELTRIILKKDTETYPKI